MASTGIFKMPPSCCPCSQQKSPEEMERRIKSRRIDRDLKVERRRFDRLIKILLLGAGESGKSTFLKQMKIIHGVHFGPEQIREMRLTIFHNAVRGMRVLFDATRKLRIPLENPDKNGVYGSQLLLLDNVAQAVNEGNFRDFRPLLASLWSDAGIKAAYDKRSVFQISESVGYFYDNLDRLAASDYEPTQQDILYCRKTTKGIHEFDMDIEGIPFKFVDVGGQRTQRQRWFQVFDSVTAILFLAAASEFDQRLLEDNETNRMREAVNVFESLVNFPGFARVSFILFLNKMDLLQEKVIERKVDIRENFSEEWTDQSEVRRHVDKFGGDQTDLSDVKAFILYLFASRVRHHDLSFGGGPGNRISGGGGGGGGGGQRTSFTNAKRQVYHHFTTAVDTRNIKFVFSSVKEMILRKNLDALMLQ